MDFQHRDKKVEKSRNKKEDVNNLIENTAMFVPVILHRIERV